MNNILISGVVVSERDPLSGIIDIDQIPTNTEETDTLNLIKTALKTPNKIASTPNYMECFTLFHKIPFTGTIQDEVTIYWGDC